MKRVVVALEWVPTYRVRFFDDLRAALQEHKVELVLVHGQPPSNKQRRGTDTTLPWAVERANRRRTIGGTEFCWQPVTDLAGDADLVIVQQESSLALNALLAAGIVRPKRWALWGHGENFNPHDRSALGERLKQWQTGRADWFFAYTEQSRTCVEQMGMPSDRITVVNNSVDGRVEDGAPSPEAERLVAEAARTSEITCWFNSSLDRWKRLDFLRDALDDIRRDVKVHMFVLGDGEGRDAMNAYAASRPWVSVLGPTFGADKRLYGDSSSLMLHPGLVGLHLVEAFQFGTPLITTAIDYHSHEFSYLEDGRNGLVLAEEATSKDYASAVVALLENPVGLEAMTRAAREAANRYTVDDMVARFARGILNALDS